MKTHPMPAQYGTEIVRSEVGSTLHGTGLPGREDRDEMGVCIEAPHYVTGLKRFEQYEYRTAGVGNRSGPGDLDLTVYSLRKYMHLATQGNPSLLLLLFAPEDRLVVNHYLGRQLRSLAPAIVSKKMIPRFRGYMRAQGLRLCGQKGSGHGTRGGGRREEYIAEFGYDTKFAMHMVRLGFQGVELATTGRMTLPMLGPAADICLDIRHGRWTAAEALDAAISLDRQLERLETESPLPDEPRWRDINQWMHHAYHQGWATMTSEYLELVNP